MSEAALDTPRPTVVLVPGLIAFSMGQTVLFAIAGPVFRDMGLSEYQLGIIVSSAAVVFVFSSAIWGRIADTWGRRPTIIFGLLSYSVISAAFAGTLQLGLNQTLAAGVVFVLLLCLRLLYAALGGGIQPASVALMADLSSGRDRSSAVAVVGAAFGIGMVLGPASAALLVGFGVLTPLYVIALLGLLSGMLALVGLPRDGSAPADQKHFEAPLRLETLGLLLAGALLTYCTMAVLQQTLAFNVQDLLALDSVEAARLTGFCFMAIAIATLVVQGGVIQVFKPGPRILLLAGPPVILVGLLVYTSAQSFLAVLIAASVIGVGFGFATPGIQAAASLLAGSREQGRVAGVMQATMSAGFVIGPLAGTAIYQLDRVYSAYLAVAAMAIALLFVMLWLALHRHTLGRAETNEST